jgi:hypothetical protein
MGKPITRTFNPNETILKFFPFKGAPCLVSAQGVVADANGKKIVKAGTPFPANDNTCLGYLLTDVDVINGDAPGTYVYEGTLDPDKLQASGVVISDAAAAKTPRVNIFEKVYGTGVGTSTSTSTSSGT